MGYEQELTCIRFNHPRPNADIDDSCLLPGVSCTCFGKEERQAAWLWWTRLVSGPRLRPRGPIVTQASDSEICSSSTYPISGGPSLWMEIVDAMFWSG